MKEKDFTEKYREETEKIVPSEDAKQRCREKMASLAEEKEPEKNKFFRFARPVLVPALCLLLAVSIVLGAFMSVPAFRGRIINTVLPDREGHSSTTIANVAPAESYKEIYEFVKDKVNGRYYYSSSAGDLNGAPEMEGDVFDRAPGASFDASTGIISDITTSEKPDSDDFSSTNTQVEGVDEGDIIKTDGKFIWTLTTVYDRDTKYLLNCYSAKGENTEKLYEYEIDKVFDDAEDDWFYFSEMYLTDGKIIVVGTHYKHVEISRWNEKYALTDCCFFTDDSRSATAVAVFFDRDENGNITFSDVLGQTGDYSTSRLAGGRLELISTYGLYGRVVEDDLYSYVPTTYENGERTYVAPDSIIIGGECDVASYVTVTSIDVSKNEITDSKTVIGTYPTVYADATDMLLALPVYDEVEKTTFTRLVFGEDGKITVGSEKTVKGSLLNQFSMDHFGGYFRIAMTVYGEWEEVEEDDMIISVSRDMRNCLLILDENLETVGALSDIAPGEKIYSVRFSGDRGYFVTFYQTDPLFAVDLSDPAAPKILDELKMPGYSAYLHNWSDDLLFGFGVNGDEDGRTDVLKLSMYSVSPDGSLSTVTNKYVSCYYSYALYDHKALLISPEKGLVGFGTEFGYNLYKYESGKFERLINAEFADSEYYTYFATLRGVYIGDDLYIWCADGDSTAEMKVYSLETFELLTEVK